MPNFQFDCERCESSFDLSFSISQIEERDKPQDCPVCGGHQTARYTFVPTRGVLKDTIPAWMMSAGNKNSSEDANEKQKAYMKSEKFYNRCKNIEARGGTVKVGGDAGL